MQISQKTWNQYKNRLAAVDKKAAEEMEAYLQRIGGYENHVEEVIKYAYALSSRYGEAAAAAACEMYDAVAEASGVNVPPAEPAATPEYKEVARAVNGTVKNSSEKQIPRTVGRLVKRTGADTTLKNAGRDGAQFAWVPAGDTCAFCLTLASRGWQYMSKNALRNGHAEHIHPNCDCQYAIRFDDKTNIAGYDPDKYREMYDNAEGDTPKEKINSMRREIAGKNKGVAKDDKDAKIKFEKASRNYMSSRDGFKKNMAEVPKLDGYQDIVCHADAFRFEYSDPDTGEIYDVLTASEFYDRLVMDGVLTDEPIRLFSCEAGKYPGGLAQNLANESGRPVLAPESNVYNNAKGYVVVANTDDEASIKFIEAIKNKRKWSLDGWVLFTPKE